MTTGKYNQFSTRLIEAMLANGHSTSRSPSGICMKTLSVFTGASEQICRRYIRGDALPDYEKISKLATNLKISPGWLLFGEEKMPRNVKLEENVLHYILKHIHSLYPVSQMGHSDYADFVLELFREVRSIDTTENNLLKIIDLAIGSISSYEEKNIKFERAI